MNKPKLKILKDGTQEWFLKGELHRVDGPALICKNGDRFWYLDGLRHRVEGPAVELADGGLAWYLDGVLHRVDGPAIVDANGTQEWRLNGLRHRVGGPALICKNGDRFWYLDGLRHRVEGPAVVYADGTQEWRLNGKRHRVDGPAVVYADGRWFWYFKDALYDVKSVDEFHTTLRNEAKSILDQLGPPPEVAPAQIEASQKTITVISGLNPNGGFEPIEAWPLDTNHPSVAARLLDLQKAESRFFLATAVEMVELINPADVLKDRP